jgi:predicted DNA-binding protein (UPF0251 family)
MARPSHPRRIALELERRVFKPQAQRMDRLEVVELTLDGLESLRLADLEGLYQEEAARRMGVSRPTFARILAGARKAVAEALVLGRAISIGGGPVVRRPRKSWPCPVHGGRRRGRGCRCGTPTVEESEHGSKSGRRETGAPPPETVPEE